MNRKWLNLKANNNAQLAGTPSFFAHSIATIRCQTAESWLSMWVVVGTGVARQCTGATSTKATSLWILRGWSCMRWGVSRTRPKGKVWVRVTAYLQGHPQMSTSSSMSDKSRSASSKKRHWESLHAPTASTTLSISLRLLKRGKLTSLPVLTKPLTIGRTLKPMRSTTSTSSTLSKCETRSEKETSSLSWAMSLVRLTFLYSSTSM